MQHNVNRTHIVFLAVVILFLAWSAFNPADWFTWILEVMPVLIAVPLLIFTYSRFRLTTLVYCLICLHAIILIVGGHYTYARMPLFDWLKDALGLARNHYDRLGHFAQGFVPAIIAREVLLRSSPLKTGRWLAVIVVSICLAVSASYELIEFAVAQITGSAADAFLGSQGDIWDSQKDMLMALAGSIIAVTMLSGYHDRLLDSGNFKKD